MEESKHQYDLRESMDKIENLGKYRWGYFLDIDDEEAMLIPAHKLYINPINIFKDVKCQNCMKKSIVCRVIPPVKEVYLCQD
mmetsp:Transcript_1765/g.1552  ORF Transcript_1765/g.1552 Transcript_1765/m.1552 type:complete len:82 (+) Transcript_1765:13-258(+)